MRERNGSAMSSKICRRRKRRKRMLMGVALVSTAVLTGMCWRFSGKDVADRGNNIMDQRETELTENEDLLSETKSIENSAEAEGWNLTLVNKWNPIPRSWETKLKKVPGGESVDERIYEPLMRMLEDARSSNNGQLPIIVSGYRTQEKQQELFEDKIREYKKMGYSKEEAEELAEQWVARPGTSEHEMGLAVDINGEIYDVYLWLQQNCYKYVFIFRYPGAKTDLTGVAEEVWHYRYVGEEAAARIQEEFLCLEEYLENREES